MVAEFDGGVLTPDAGRLLLGAADRRLDLVRRLAGCFRDARDARFVEHSVAMLVGQHVFGIALAPTEPGRLRVRPRPQRAARQEISVELLQAEAEAASTGKPARRFKDFRYATTAGRAGVG